MNTFKNKTVLVTGASSGIGEAIAHRFIKEGANVVAFDLKKPEYECTFYKVDVRNENEIEEVISKIPTLDVVVNSAGIYFLESVENTSKKKLDDIVDINLKGTFLICKYTLPLLRKSKGNIVNIASGLGVVPEPGSPAYCATKAAVIMLTKCLSQEHGKEGIRVNAVLPGPIDTPLLRNSFTSENDLKISISKNPLRKIGKAEDVANVVYFLASDEASFVTGGLYSVDGGESVSSVYSN